MSANFIASRVLLFAALVVACATGATAIVTVIQSALHLSRVTPCVNDVLTALLARSWLMPASLPIWSGRLCRTQTWGQLASTEASFTRTQVVMAELLTPADISATSKQCFLSPDNVHANRTAMHPLALALVQVLRRWVIQPGLCASKL